MRPQSPPEMLPNPGSLRSFWQIQQPNILVLL
jgi:hypothetical protein